MPTYTDRDAALAVECPKCYAEPGGTCCSENGSNVEPIHDERIDYLRAHVRYGVNAYHEHGATP